MKSGENALIFQRPASCDVLMMLVVGDVFYLLFVAFTHEVIEYRSPFVVAALYFLTVALMVLGEIQRVTIDGTTVQIANAASMLRTRSFAGEAVERVAYSESVHGGMGECLVVHLAPALHRTWTSVQLYALKSTAAGKDDGTPLFTAFMRAVLLAQPGIKVKQLPREYRDLLPPGRESSLPSPSARPSAKRGKAERQRRKKEKDFVKP